MLKRVLQISFLSTLGLFLLTRGLLAQTAPQAESRSNSNSSLTPANSIKKTASSATSKKSNKPVGKATGARVNNEPVLVNKVLFHLQNEAYTLQDLQFFARKEKQLVPGLSDEQSLIISKLSPSERLMLFELAAREAESLELPSEITTESEGDPVGAEKFKRWGRALSYLSTKQSVFQERDRFDSWFQLIQNKYDVVLKE